MSQSDTAAHPQFPMEKPKDKYNATRYATWLNYKFWIKWIPTTFLILGFIAIISVGIWILPVRGEQIDTHPIQIMNYFILFIILIISGIIGWWVHMGEE